MLTPTEARDIAQSLVAQAVRGGATAADAMLASDRSMGVQIRLGELEDVSRSEGQEIGLRVFVGQRSASVASSDLRAPALEALVERAVAMAREAPEDEFAGLAPAGLLLTGDVPDIDGWDDRPEPDPVVLRARALEAESAARGISGITNSGGGSAGASASTIALATSHGFARAYCSSGHSCSVSVIAGDGSGMQRDYAYDSVRHEADLEDAEAIGRRAGERAAKRVNPGKPAPGRMAVLFDPRVSSSLLGHFTSAINGSSIARGTSFLGDKMGERLFAAGVTIRDEPLRRRGVRSRPFDGEGLPVHELDLIDDGVLTTWLAESAAARQLGIVPTGHASRGVGGSPGAGPSNLVMLAGKRSREELLGAFPQAILITELIGMGVNGVTGDYSRGASGFLVSNGEIGAPVSEFTIAGNLLEMFRTLEPGSDLERRRGIDAPTILIPEMAVAAG